MVKRFQIYDTFCEILNLAEANMNFAKFGNGFAKS